MIPAELRSRIQCLNSDYMVFLPEEHDGSKLKVYPDEGHGAGRAVVAEQGFYDWLFSHTRDEMPLQRSHAQ